MEGFDHEIIGLCYFNHSLAWTYLSKPGDDLGEVITTVCSLLLAAQHSRSIDQVDTSQDAARHLTPFETTQKGYTESF